MDFACCKLSLYERKMEVFDIIKFVFFAFVLLFSAGIVLVVLYLIGFFFDIDRLTKTKKKAFIDSFDPPLAKYGFRKVTTHFNGERKDTMCARFEKLNSREECEWIEFQFEKYGRLRFQVHTGVTNVRPPYKHKRTGSLVRKRSQYYHYWGVRLWWFFPNWTWAFASRQVKERIPQIIEYLTSGRAGQNIHGADWK